VRGRVAAGKTCSCHVAVMRTVGTGRNEDRWPDVAPVALVVRALSVSAGARKIAASVVGPDRTGRSCVKTLGDGYR
jgi:hypothetical protein